MPGNSKLGLKEKKPAKAEDREDFPSFGESALASLTAKIEKGLQRDPQAPSKKRTSQLTSDAKAKKKRSDDERGTKRDAEGNVKPFENSLTKRRTISEPATGEDLDQAILLQEIMALGGTEDDLELIAGAASATDDETFEENKSALSGDKTLRKEIESFVAELGIENNSFKDVSEDDTDESDLSMGSSKEKIHTENQETEKTRKKAINQASQESEYAPQNSNRLVSIYHPILTYLADALTVI